MANSATTSQSQSDFSRTVEHIDADIVGAANLVIVGVGGAGGLVMDLARSGVRNFTLIDLDFVSPTNIATQFYFQHQVGQPKVRALSQLLMAINPDVSVTEIHARYEEIEADRRAALFREASIVLAMTDSHQVQKTINADALKHGKPMIAAMMGDGLQQMEVTGTIPETVKSGGGCFLCQVWPREKAYREGFMNRAVIGSHVVSATMLNAQIAYVTLGVLHHLAGSDKPIARIGARFAASPCLLTQLDPAFWAVNPSGYGVVPDGMELFTTKLFTIDTPKGWVCEACATEGHA